MKAIQPIFGENEKEIPKGEIVMITAIALTNVSVFRLA